jgi:ATP-dependent Clp protease protease subunit
MDFFDIKNKNDIGEVYIYGPITDEKWFDEDITPTWFKDQVEKLKGLKNINIFINSPGGGVFAGMAIHSILKRQSAEITSYIDGIAASIASVIAMAAKKIIMPKNALMMIHNPNTAIIGTADDLRKEADLLDRIKNTIVSTYSDKTKKDDKKIREMMDAETWMDGNEAKSLGFADVVPDSKVKACLTKEKIIFDKVSFDYRNYKKFPASKFTVENRNLTYCNNLLKIGRFLNESK